MVPGLSKYIPVLVICASMLSTDSSVFSVNFLLNVIFSLLFFMFIDVDDWEQF